MLFLSALGRTLQYLAAVMCASECSSLLQLAVQVCHQVGDVPKQRLVI